MNPWHRITFKGLRRLTLEAPEVLRWKWQVTKKRGGSMQLLSPRGVLWDFKLDGRPYIRKSPTVLLESSDERH